jgi:hypothetical protein
MQPISYGEWQRKFIWFKKINDQWIFMRFIYQRHWHTNMFVCAEGFNHALDLFDIISDNYVD